MTGKNENDGSIQGVDLDRIGYWSIIKHDIIESYAKAYSTILSKQSNLEHYYIDAFSGAGLHRAKGSGEIVKGSPLRALEVSPPFRHFFFIDTDKSKSEFLQRNIGVRRDVDVFSDDCNEVLFEKVFPLVTYTSYKRALCLLDPYGLDLDWKVIKKAGEMGTIEIFLNFPVLDIQRNLVTTNPDSLLDRHITRMDRFWGSHDWFGHLYGPDLDMFDESRQIRFERARGLMAPFATRLKEVAGFKFVPEPVLMTNTQGGDLYFLVFASHNDTGRKIVKTIFDKYRRLGHV